MQHSDVTSVGDQVVREASRVREVVSALGWDVLSVDGTLSSSDETECVVDTSAAEETVFLSDDLKREADEDGQSADTRREHDGKRKDSQDAWHP